MCLAILLILLALALFATAPKLSRKDEWRSFAGSGLFAHRGLFDNEGPAPENSLPAFQKAVAAKYGIELDVQLTKDGELVVHHDQSLWRSCGIDRRVSDLTLAQLRQLRLFRSKEAIPLFSEALALINGQAPLIVEIKSGASHYAAAEKTAAVLQGYPGRYVIESFDPYPLRWYRRRHPEILRGQLSTDYFRDHSDQSPLVSFILTNYLANFFTRPDFIADDFRYASRPGFRIQRFFWRASAAAWAPHSEEDLRRARPCFDVFIFDSFAPRS